MRTRWTGSSSTSYDWDGIVRVDAKDIPGKNTVYLMTEDQPALVDTLIRHAEEPVALIACESEKLLDARRHVRRKPRHCRPF